MALIISLWELPLDIKSQVRDGDYISLAAVDVCRRSRIYPIVNAVCGLLFPPGERPFTALAGLPQPPTPFIGFRNFLWGTSRKGGGGVHTCVKILVIFCLGLPF